MCPCSANYEGKDQCLSMVFSLELWKAGVKVAHKVPLITAPCIRPLQTLDGYLLGGPGTFSGIYTPESQAALHCGLNWSPDLSLRRFHESPNEEQEVAHLLVSACLCQGDSW